MPKTAQQVIEEFKNADQNQRTRQQLDIRRVAFVIDKVASQLTVIEDDEKFPVENKRDSFDLHRFARELNTIADQAAGKNVSEKQLDKSINTMYKIDVEGVMSTTIDKNTAELLENPALEGKTYFEAMPEMLKKEGLAFNQKQFNDALGFVNDYFELENDLEPFGIKSASQEEQKENAEEPDYEDEINNTMDEITNVKEIVDDTILEPTEEEKKRLDEEFQNELKAIDEEIADAKFNDGEKKEHEDEIDKALAELNGETIDEEITEEERKELENEFENELAKLDGDTIDEELGTYDGGEAAREIMRQNMPGNGGRQQGENNLQQGGNAPQYGNGTQPQQRNVNQPQQGGTAPQYGDGMQPRQQGNVNQPRQQGGNAPQYGNGTQPRQQGNVNQPRQQGSNQQRTNTAPTTNTAPQTSASRPQQQVNQTTNNIPSTGTAPTTAPKPAAGSGPLVIGGNRASAPANARFFTGTHGPVDFREFMENEMAAASGKPMGEDVKSSWEQFLDTLFGISQTTRNDEAANDLHKQIKENGMNFNDPKSAKEMVDHVRGFIDKNMSEIEKEKVASGIKQLDRLSNHLGELEAFKNSNLEKENIELQKLQNMFSTRSGRLAIDSNDYKKAKSDFSDYMNAREALEQNYRAGIDAALRSHDPKQLESIREDRKKLEKICAEKEKTLKTSMDAYVRKVSKNGTKSIEDMGHGYGAARLASGNGVMDFLNSKTPQRTRQSLKDGRSAERTKEVKYRDLYMQNRMQTLNSRDRKRKAADAALEGIKKNKNKQNVL